MKTIFAFAIFSSVISFAGDIQFRLDGRDRVASLHYPLISRRLYPTVIGLHGGGGNKEELLHDARLRDRTRLRGMLLVLAEGTGPLLFNGKRAATWNAGRCCGSAVEENVGDVAYLRELIRVLVTKHQADPRKIYLVGFSNGAQMAYRAACELSDQITAIGLVGSVGVFDSQAGLHDNCARAKGVDTIHIQGTEDPCSPSQGGAMGACHKKFIELYTGMETDFEQPHVALEPADSFFRKWSHRMGASHLRVENIGMGNRCQAYGKGRLTIRNTRYCSIVGAGHTWPGGSYGPLCAFGALSKLCRTWREVISGSRDTLFAPYPYYDASGEILDFLQVRSR